MARNVEYSKMKVSDEIRERWNKENEDLREYYESLKAAGEKLLKLSEEERQEKWLEEDVLCDLLMDSGATLDIIDEKKVNEKPEYSNNKKYKQYLEDRKNKEPGKYNFNKIDDSYEFFARRVQMIFPPELQIIISDKGVISNPCDPNNAYKAGYYPYIIRERIKEMYVEKAKEYKDSKPAVQRYMKLAYEQPYNEEGQYVSIFDCFDNNTEELFDLLYDHIKLREKGEKLFSDVGGWIGIDLKVREKIYELICKLCETYQEVWLISGALERIKTYVVDCKKYSLVKSVTELKELVEGMEDEDWSAFPDEDITKLCSKINGITNKIEKKVAHEPGDVETEIDKIVAQLNGKA